MSEVVLTTYSSISPLMQYAPAYDVESTQGWRTKCIQGEEPSAIGPESYLKVQCVGGEQNARRITSAIGASLSFEFYGKGAQVYGSAVNTSYTYRVDSETSFPRFDWSGNGNLFGVSDLTEGWHTLEITLVDNGSSISETVAEISIARVEFDAGVRSNDTMTTAPALLSTSTWTFTDTQDDQWWLLHNVFRNSDGSDSDRVQDGVLTRLPGAKATLSFTGTSISIIGDMLFDHGLYTVSLFPTSSPSTSNSPPYRTLSLNGKSNYTFDEALLFFAGGLDPGIEHTIVLENKAEDFLDIVRAVVVGGPQATVGGSGTVGANGAESSSPTKNDRSPSAKRDLPAILGAAIGGALALLLGMLAVLILVRRKRQRQRLANLTSHQRPWLEPPAMSWTPPASSTPIPSSPAVQPFVPDFEQSLNVNSHIIAPGDQSQKVRVMETLGKGPQMLDLASGATSTRDLWPARQVDRMAKIRTMEELGKAPRMFEERTWTAGMANGSGSSDRRNERVVDELPFSVTGTLPPAYSR